MEASAFSVTRVGYAVVAVIGLALVYMFQYTDFLSLMTGVTSRPEYHFITSRVIRILLNDSFMLLLIYALFNDRGIVRLAICVQLIDLFVLLPLYLLFKLPGEGASELSSPFLSQFHRLIVNPTLMVLLIGGVYYQKLGKKSVT